MQSASVSPSSCILLLHEHLQHNYREILATQRRVRPRVMRSLVRRCPRQLRHAVSDSSRFDPKLLHQCQIISLAVALISRTCSVTTNSRICCSLTRQTTSQRSHALCDTSHIQLSISYFICNCCWKIDSGCIDFYRAIAARSNELTERIFTERMIIKSFHVHGMLPRWMIRFWNLFEIA